MGNDVRRPTSSASRTWRGALACPKPATADRSRGSWFGAIHCQRGGRGG